MICDNGPCLIFSVEMVLSFVVVRLRRNARQHAEETT